MVLRRFCYPHFTEKESQISVDTVITELTFGRARFKSRSDFKDHDLSQNHAILSYILLHTSSRKHRNKGGKIILFSQNKQL